jgi:hypothetical protein
LAQLHKEAFFRKIPHFIEENHVLFRIFRHQKTEKGNLKRVRVVTDRHRPGTAILYLILAYAVAVRLK